MDNKIVEVMVDLNGEVSMGGCIDLKITKMIEMLQEIYCEIGVLITYNTKNCSLNFPVEWLDLHISDDGDSLYFEDMNDHMIKVEIENIKDIVVSDDYETGEKVTRIVVEFGNGDNLVVEILEI